MSNLFVSVFKSMNADPDDVYEGENAPVEGETMVKAPPPTAAPPTASTQMAAKTPPTTPARAPRASAAPAAPSPAAPPTAAAPMRKSFSETIFPTITTVGGSLQQTHGTGGHWASPIGKSCGGCGRIYKSVEGHEGNKCIDCEKSMRNVRWHTSHLE